MALEALWEMGSSDCPGACCPAIDRGRRRPVAGRAPQPPPPPPPPPPRGAERRAPPARTSQHGHCPGILHGIIAVCRKRDASDALLVVVTVGIASGAVMASLRPSPSRRLYPPCLRYLSPTHD
ncbi:hypothetical protein DAI22_09g185000 [Oryza sativa Japonica Group]|nr:hypothetical protein DAI22_09g185000 [Oryza sativa Japonica Group]